MPASHAATGSSGDRKLIVTRLIDAPAALVFDAFTNPEHISHWWGPHGFTTTTSEMDVKPGGTWRFVMHGPDGRAYRNRIIFVEIDRPHRLVYRHEPEAGAEPVSHETTVTFVTEGNQTRLTMNMLFPTAANRDYVIKTYGADEGGKQTLQRLAVFVAQMAPGIHKDLVLTRVFDAPRDLVFQACIDPQHLSKWWGPHQFTAEVREIDVRPGGRLAVQMRSPEGTAFPMHGVYVEVDRPNRLVFITGLTETDGTIRVEVRNTMTFSDEGPWKTAFRLEVSVITATDAAAANLAGMETGWSRSLERLATLVRTESARERS